MSEIAEILIELPFVPAVILKATLLLATAWSVHVVLQRANPRWRVLMWRGVLVGLVALPIVEWAFPAIEIAFAKQPIAPSIGQNTIPISAAGETISADVARSVVTNPTQVKPAASEFSIREWVVDRRVPLSTGLWAIVSLVLLAGMGRGWLRVRRVLKQVLHAPHGIVECAQRVAAALGMKQRFTLGVLQGLGSPFLTGIFRPVIVLPSRGVEEGDSERMRAVLAHELVHAKSSDPFWMAFARAAESLLWFHPLVWGIRSVHNAACEEVCDGVASQYVGSAESYSQVLARETLALLDASPAPGGVPMLRTAEIVSRLRKIQRGIPVTPLGLRRVTASFLAAAAFMGVLGSVRLVRAQQTGDAEIVRQIVAQQEKVKDRRLRITYQRTYVHSDGAPPTVYDCELLAYNGDYRETCTTAKGQTEYHYFYDGLRATYTPPVPVSNVAGSNSASTLHELEYNPYHFVHHIDTDLAHLWSNPSVGFYEQVLKRGKVIRGRVSPNGEPCVWLELSNNAYAFSEARGFTWCARLNPAADDASQYERGDVNAILVGSEFQQYGQDLWLPRELIGKVFGSIKVTKVDVDADFSDDMLTPPQPQDGWRIKVSYPLWRPDLHDSSMIAAMSFEWSTLLDAQDDLKFEVARAYWRFDDYHNAKVEGFPVPYYDADRSEVVWARRGRLKDTEQYVGFPLPAEHGTPPWMRSDDPDPASVEQDQK